MNRKIKEKLAFTLIELLVVVATVALLLTVLLPAMAGTRAEVARLNCVDNLKRVGLAFQTWAEAHEGRFPMKVSDYEGGAAGAVPAAGMVAPNMWRVFQVLSNELGSPQIVNCPADDRLPRSNFLNHVSGQTLPDFYDNTAVSYFVGVDADETRPQMFLSGDRNIGSAPTHPASPYGYSATTTIGGAYQLGTNSSVIQWTDRLHRKTGNVVLADGSVQQLTAVSLRESLRRTGDTSGNKYVPVNGAFSGQGNNVLLP